MHAGAPDERRPPVRLHVLHRFDYGGRDDEVVGTPDPLIVGPASLVIESPVSGRMLPHL